ncbi:MAG TPA: thioredoxin-dependent thiol peroxidase [Patescibacteria group bacterium]|nr:thioredoxin-dependent thiol peroxidase [Patescibacteria group bacterium]
MQSSDLLQKMAPNFSLSDQDGKMHTLSDYRGKWVILYFYPKDDTPGCTKEACSFRDNTQQLTQKDIVVLAVSADSPASHKKFAEKYHLSFPLLADVEKETIKAYGAWGKKKFMGKEYDGILRTTFLIDPRGVVKKVFENVTPADHAREILTFFDTQ